MEVNQRVLVRAESAGVHYGTLKSFNGRVIQLINARRIWNWTGALSLSEIAMTGVNLQNSKISVAVDEIILPTAVEVISINIKSNLP